MEYYLAIRRNNSLNRDKPKRRKPNAKDCILNDFIYRKFPENTSPGQQVSGTEQGLTVSRYNVWGDGNVIKLDFSDSCTTLISLLKKIPKLYTTTDELYGIKFVSFSMKHVRITWKPVKTQIPRYPPIPDMDSAGLGWDPRMCNSKKLPEHAIKIDSKVPPKVYYTESLGKEALGYLHLLQIQPSLSTRPQGLVPGHSTPSWIPKSKDAPVPHRRCTKLNTASPIHFKSSRDYL